MAEVRTVNQMLADTFEPKRQNRWFFEFAEDVVINKQIYLEPELIIALITDHLSLTRSDTELLKIMGYARASSFNYLFEKKIGDG